jgi:hypothetical protein
MGVMKDYELSTQAAGVTALARYRRRHRGADPESEAEIAEALRYAQADMAERG